jgi:hypothetical protein
VPDECTRDVTTVRAHPVYPVHACVMCTGDDHASGWHRTNVRCLLSIARARCPSEMQYRCRALPVTPAVASTPQQAGALCVGLDSRAAPLRAGSQNCTILFGGLVVERVPCRVMLSEMGGKQQASWVTDLCRTRRDVLEHAADGIPTDVLRALAACPPGGFSKVRRAVAEGWRTFADSGVPTPVTSAKARVLLAKALRCRDVGTLANLLDPREGSEPARAILNGHVDDEASAQEEEDMTRVVLWCERGLAAVITQAFPHGQPDAAQAQALHAMTDEACCEAKIKALALVRVAELVGTGMCPSEVGALFENVAKC